MNRKDMKNKNWLMRLIEQGDELVSVRIGEQTMVTTKKFVFVEKDTKRLSWSKYLIVTP